MRDGAPVPPGTTVVTIPPETEVTTPSAPATTVEPTQLDTPRPDLRATGALGWALLRGEVPNAVLEIDTADGVALSDEAVETLQQQLAEHGSKSVEVVREGGLPAQDTYAAQELVEIARDHRSRRSSDDTIAIHALVLPGAFEQEGALGIAFLSTTFAIFPEAIGGRLPEGASQPEYESAVVTHELGHLFGLVNLTGVGEFHEDENHRGHSANRDSVMHVAVEIAPVGLDVSPTRSFDQADRREMERIRQQRPG